MFAAGRSSNQQIVGRLELALLALGVVAYLSMPHGVGPDGATRWYTTEQLRAGHITDTRYSIVQSVLALPLYLAGELIDYPFGMVAVFNTLVTLGGLALLAFLLRPHVSAALLRRLLLVLMAGSMFGHHAQFFYGEVLTAVCAGVGLLCLVVGANAIGYALMIVGVVNTPAALPAMFLSLFARRGQRRLWHAAWPVAVATAIAMLEFYVRRGSPFLSGYEGDAASTADLMPYGRQGGFSFPIVFGVLAILFSFGRGLALFTPGLWLLFRQPVDPVPDTMRRFQRSAVWFLIGLVLVYAKWWSWNGAWFWGPRFFLFACFPASVALAVHLCDAKASLRAKALTLAVLAWSIWVGIDGVAIGLKGLDVCFADNRRLEALCWYTVEYSALFRPFTEFPPIPWRQGLVAAYFALVGVVLAAPFGAELIQAGVIALRRLPQTLRSAGSLH